MASGGPGAGRAEVCWALQGATCLAWQPGGPRRPSFLSACGADRGLCSERLLPLKGLVLCCLDVARPCRAVCPSAGSPLGDAAAASKEPRRPWAAFSLPGLCGLLWPLEKLHPAFPCRVLCTHRPGHLPPDAPAQGPLGQPVPARYAAKVTRSPQLPSKRSTACLPAPRRHGLRPHGAPRSPASEAGLAWKVPVTDGCPAVRRHPHSRRVGWDVVTVPPVRAGPARARARTRIPVGRPAPGPPFVVQPLAVRPLEDVVRCRVAPGCSPHRPGRVPPAAAAGQTAGAS